VANGPVGRTHVVGLSYRARLVARRDPAGLAAATFDGDRTALARLLSFVEQGGDAARLIGGLTWPRGGGAYTVGITGAPGAGKSTLTDRLIATIRAGGDEVAVLCIDPSSPFSGGAILGDRVRMSDHYLDSGVFIRSMATRGHLGGLALAAPEAVRALDAAGFRWILIETVGVGQVEVEIAGAADTTMVVVTPGWGDSVQANKAGILEIGDLFVINKAERAGAAETERDLLGMLELTSMSHDAWRPPILRTTAANGSGIAELWAAVISHRDRQRADGTLEQRRAVRVDRELREIVVRLLERRALGLCAGERYDTLLSDIVARRIDPHAAAKLVIESA
jgi:LAO/AO transport system kinase